MPGFCARERAGTALARSSAVPAIIVTGVRAGRRAGGAKAHEVFRPGPDCGRGRDPARRPDEAPPNRNLQVHGEGCLGLHLLGPDAATVDITKGMCDTRCVSFVAGLVDVGPARGAGRSVKTRLGSSGVPAEGKRA